MPKGIPNFKGGDNPYEALPPPMTFNPADYPELQRWDRVIDASFRDHEADVRSIDPIKEITSKDEFMFQKCIVKFAKANTTTEFDQIRISVNGEAKIFPRNVPVEIRRDFLEQALGLKSDHVDVADVNAFEGGQSLTKKTIEANPRFICQVLFDPSGTLGQAWQRQVLSRR